MRHGLLLTAVATVSVPGVLAMLAVLGHEHVPAGVGVTAALDGTPVAESAPLAPAIGHPVVRSDVAGAQPAAGASVSVLSNVTSGQQGMGMRLLDLAANASLTTSYQGTEVITQSGVDGSIRVTCRLWHQGGGRTLVETSDAATPAAKSSNIAVASSDPASGSPEGVFGVTKNLVALLGEHYVVQYWGSGSVDYRPASVVELYRSDGSLAARYWLDDQTMVPLRRELYDTSGHVISEDSFVQVQFDAISLPRIASTGAGQAEQAQPTWVAAASPAKFLTSLTGQGWQLPTTAPGRLPLYAAASTMTASGEIVDLEYSDGLYDVSLFVQRGTLAPDIPGWQRVSVAGQQAFVSGYSVTWAERGFVYTVIADAPPQTVGQVIKALPDTPPGFLDRLGRGLVRLIHVINPFG